MKAPTVKKLFSYLMVIASFSAGKKDTTTDNDITNGLILHLPFSSNLNDLSNSKNNGILFNGTASFTTDRYFDDGRALRLSTGQYVEIQDKGISDLQQFTFYIEFYPTSSSYQVLVGKRAYQVTPGTPYNQSMNIAINDQLQVRAQLRKAGQCQSNQLSAYHPELTSGDNLVMLGCWNYVACTFDGTTQKLFLNGRLVSQQSLSGVVICDTDPIRLGAWWQDDPFFYNGLLDEFRIYNRALSESEIKQLYKLSKSS